MNFNLSQLAAGFVFGVFGIYLFRQGKKQVHWVKLSTGLALMVFPYFLDSPIWIWPVGVLLVWVGYASQ